MRKDISKENGAIRFNRETEGQLTPLQIFVKNRRVRFSVYTCKAIGATPGTHVEFIKLGNQYYLSVTGNKRGYHVADSKSRAGNSCNCSKLARDIIATLNAGKNEVECYLYLEPSYELAGKPVYRMEKRIKH